MGEKVVSAPRQEGKWNQIKSEFHFKEIPRKTLSWLVRLLPERNSCFLEGGMVAAAVSDGEPWHCPGSGSCTGDTPGDTLGDKGAMPDPPVIGSTTICPGRTDSANTGELSWARAVLPFPPSHNSGNLLVPLGPCFYQDLPCIGPQKVSNSPWEGKQCPG